MTNNHIGLLTNKICRFLEMWSRKIQTLPFLNEAQQTQNDQSSQTERSGFHLSKTGDRIIEASGHYQTASDYIDVQIVAVSFRPFLNSSN